MAVGTIWAVSLAAAAGSLVAEIHRPDSSIVQASPGVLANGSPAPARVVITPSVLVPGGIFIGGVFVSAWLTWRARGLIARLERCERAIDAAAKAKRRSRK